MNVSPGESLVCPAGPARLVFFGFFSGLDRAARKTSAEHQSGRAGLVN
jgi:hypothetical protein